MERIGFIGLGAMGKPMAQNLMRAGFSLSVLTRTRSKIDDVLATGATWRDTPKEISQNSDVIITMLPDTPDVVHVIAGKDGVFEGARAGRLIVDMSTISPLAAKQLAREAETRGCDFLDAPVSGGDIGAQKGALSIMVGGKESAFARALPIFQAMGQTILRIGESGAGQITKAANQIMAAINLEATCEALVFAAKAGVDPVLVRQALMGGAAYSRSLEFHGQRILDRNFVPGFRLRLHRKDLDIALATGQEYGIALPVTAQVREMMTELLNAGQGDMDNSSLVVWLQQLATKASKNS